MGLEDVRRELENIIVSDKSMLFASTRFPVDAAMLLQKVLGIIVLCSFTDNKVVLETWAKELLNEVLIVEINVISTSLKQIDKTSTDYRAYCQYWTSLYEVYILLEAAKCVGQITFNRNREQETYITFIYELCEDLHEPFSEQVFKWLEKVFNV